MLHLIPAPLHRLLYRAAYRVRAYWRRLAKPSSFGISVIARDDDGRVLLVRHSYGSGRWALPGGGRGRNENPETCARREMREELGCELTDLALFEISYRKIHGASDRSHVFSARIEGEPRPDGREIVEAGWFALDSLPPDLVPTSRLQLERFRSA
jgi:8-oxo-dGTP pyrophosphatase MutT (NUDIX family)